ncbi:SusC/RagA family TonB-linked outer membrane protein [Sphingobacterium bovistauri]|uniref:SusC/RagA family TonB-linked outer membrane protein n=1 Tax=Sphingobacterium bovistauri TaxID=2781959 RepID=A0ABS7Z666_9SPHI|nr:SusC/RagA family TonB-linked outer membrane protein [Sphingobacterium bovistauri]MCA5004345.1 SusC/RagA family TonB-linked outer membrane protein [Sphingobacterium bovistauri]
MKQKLLSTMFAVACVTSMSYAQTREVSGLVTSSDGTPISGASISVVGTNTATQTDGYGRFKISASSGATLNVSYIGYTSQRVSIGNSTNLSIVLKGGDQALDEVVVTGVLGIERQKKEIGYATAKVDKEALTATKAVNVASGLQGKVSGLNITPINNGVFEDIKINLRGIRSLTGNNNPMLLLDGVPSAIGYLSSINPNDIEDVQVLKGSSAAAIYGPDARNGVIVVTTKKSSTTPNISLSQSTQFSQISFFPKLQEKFGNGAYGEYTGYENWSWGPAFDGSQVEIGDILPDGTIQMVPYTANNDRQDFFNTGKTYQTDVSYSTNDVYFSVQDALVKGIVPDDKNRRTGLRLNTAKEYGIFKISLNANYINSDYSVFNDAGMASWNAANNVGLNSGLMNLIFNTPAHIPLTKYKDFLTDPYAEYNTYFNHYGLNPYFAIDNWRNDGKRTDLLSNLEMTLKPTDWMSVTWRGGVTSRAIDENTTSKGEVPTSYGLNRGATLIPGTVSERAYYSRRYSSELFANFNKQLNEDFKLGGVLGTYVRSTNTRDASVGASNLVVPELFNTGNRTGELTGGSSMSESRMFSIYGSASLNYKGWANIEFVGRNDKTSVLPIDNNSFFYPGVNAALVLTDALPQIKGEALTFLKFRGGWNETGNADINPYSLEATFGQASGFPYGSLAGFTAGNTTYDAKLKPEFISSTEFGFDAGFWGGRVNLEGTVYRSLNENQIVGVSVSSATGYTLANVNAASFINKGFELDLKLRSNTTAAFKPKFAVNLSYNDNEVTQIYEGLDELAVSTGGLAQNYAIKGHPAYVLKTTDYNRDPQGRIIVDAITGYPTADPNTKIYGRTLPKWIIGLNPSFDYKNFNFSTLFEYKGGHYAYADIGNAMAWTGVSEASASNNRERFVLPNSSYADPANAGQYIANENVTIANVNDFYTGVYRTVGTNFLTSASAWRLREVALSYQLPQTLLSQAGFIKSAAVSLTGRNLFLWVPKTNKFQDPDFNFTSGNAAGISTSQINPPVRTFGANLTVNF